MPGTRLALGAVVAALGIVALGNFSSSSGQEPNTQRSGFNYGGSRADQLVWVRLTRSKSLVIVLQIPYQVARERCSHRKGYGGAVIAGTEYDELIFIRDGKFRKKIADDFRFRGDHYEERLTVTGTVTDERVAGTLEGKVKITADDGKVIRCRVGPQRWDAVN